MDIRRVASTFAIALGALMILGAAATALMVRSELGEQRIVTPDDACLPGNEVKGPFTAWCQAKGIDNTPRS